jgi:hypothetical protein
MPNPKNLGLAGGILFGVSIFVFTLISMYTGYASGVLQLLGNIYPGYNVSIMGSILGLIYGFLDGFIGLYIFAWLYNYLERKK